MAAKKKMNLPNKLTLFRVALVPVTVVLLLFPGLFGKGEHAGDFACLAAAVAFSVTSLTDMLDGKIARKYNLITNFGKFMDPLADKFMVFSVLIAMCVPAPSLHIFPSVARRLCRLLRRGLVRPFDLLRGM